MSIQVQSTTDAAEAVTAAIGDLAEKPVEQVEEKKSESAPKETDETADESETSDADEVENNDSDEGEADEKPKKKGGFQRRIDKITRERAEAQKAEAEAKKQSEYWREQALRNQKPEAEKPVDKTKAPEGKPNKDDFESHDDYVEALADWKFDQKLSARDAKAKEIEVKAEQQKLLNSHVEKVSVFKKDHPDFDERMESVDDVPLSFTVKSAILKYGPELQYALAGNREELARICALPFEDAAFELGMFRAKIAKTESSEEKQKTTKAPTPISPVKTGSTGSGRKSLSDPNLTQREYEALRNEMMKKRA